VEVIVALDMLEGPAVIPAVVPAGQHAGTETVLLTAVDQIAVVLTVTEHFHTVEQYLNLRKLLEVARELLDLAVVKMEHSLDDYGQTRGIAVY